MKLLVHAGRLWSVNKCWNVSVVVSIWLVKIWNYDISVCKILSKF